jgi:demethylmenaquinone methyltransferase/2-methoxy-6-polyprenyl-1,4-benzoquinol methylase
VAPGLDETPASNPIEAEANAVPEPLRPRAADTQIAGLFDEIAPVYDRLTRLVSFGRDGRWRSAMVAATGVAAGDAALDVATGTGKLAVALADRVGPFGQVVALDLSPVMVERGSAATRDIVQLEFVVGDARALPFDEGRFDAATVAFCLTSVGDLVLPFAEIRRVLRPGGRLVCLERTVPRPAVWGRAYGAAVRRLAPLAGRAVGGGDAYRRIAAAGTPPRPLSDLTAALQAAGFVDVTSRRLWLGSVALLRGVRPAS